MASDGIDCHLGNENSVSLKVISLNINGLRNKTKHISLLLSKYRPDFIFLQETNINDHFTERQIIELLHLDSGTCFFNYITSFGFLL